MGIPRVLHFIWLGATDGDPIPADRQACIDRAAELHPGWDLRVWTSLDQFGLLHNKRAFFDADAIAPKAPRGNPHQIRTNVLRFEIMARHGGVFLDSDVWCLRPLDEVTERTEAGGYDGFLGWEIEQRWLGEAVIGCVPGAAFMARIVDHLEPWAFARRRQAATCTVGPQFITPLLVGTPELARVAVFSQQHFFPARHDEPDLSDALVEGRTAAHPDTVAVHRFGNFRRKRALGLVR